MISKLGLAKTAALITAVACVVFVIFVPKILAALMVLPILILCYEVAIATGNLQSIVDQFSREWMQQRHPRDLIPMLTKGTLLTKIIVSKMERDGVFN